MRARTIILITGIVLLLYAVWHADIAAAYVAFFATAIIWGLHTIDFKLNLLLKERGITVSEREVNRSR